MTPLVECLDLGFAIGPARLVHGVSLEVRCGEVVAVVGANGAGKSTLLRLLSGETKPTAGLVRLQGRALTDYGARDLARLRAVLPQKTTIEFAYSVREVVEMGRSPHHEARPLPRLGRSRTRQAACLRVAPREHDDTVVDECLGRAGVAHLAARAYPSLSGGEQARVCFARVLAQETPLVLLDEPTAALDIRFQHLVLGEARRLAEDGRAVVAVLHDLNLAAGYADRIVVMQSGGVVADGTPGDVLREDVLSRVYGHPITVLEDPATGRPLLVPRPAYPTVVA